jgi:hypothetical protein
MPDEELIKTMWTVAQYGDNQKVGGLLQLAAHRLEDLNKELAEAKAVQTVMYPKAPPSVSLSACEGLQP